MAPNGRGCKILGRFKKFVAPPTPFRYPTDMWSYGEFWPWALYLTALLGGLIVVATRRSGLDVRALAFLSFALYTSPCIFGFTSLDYIASYGVGHDPERSLVPETYTMVTLVLAIMGATILIPLRAQSLPTVPRQVSVSTDKIAFFLSATIAAASFFLQYYTIGSDLFIEEKELLMERLGRALIIFEVASSFLLPLAFLLGGWWRYAIALGFLLVSLSTGFRTGFAMSLLGTMLLINREHGMKPLIQQWRILFPLALSLVAMLLLKELMWEQRAALADGDFGYLFEKFFDSSTYERALYLSEPFTNIAVINEVIRTDFSVPWTIAARDTLSLVLPNASAWGVEARGFNAEFQPALFPGIQFGMAASVWAQMHSSAGIAGVVSFAFLFCLIARQLDAVLHRWSGLARAFLAVNAASFAFYFNRNDLLFQGLIHRRYFLVFLVLWILVAIIGHVRNDRAANSP